MKDVIVVAVLAAIVVLIVRYLANFKKRGEVCIGCPYSKQCGTNCGSNAQKKYRS
ncbi:MAG TPA: hypothetical protein PK631_04520 [Erysipelotrichaceae bacterium]|nr:hypothetical protein [Erysipelotrichaceae bacterium]